MRKAIRFHGALALAVCLASASALAQSTGEAIFKARCQDCHGPTGLSDTKMAMALKIKPVTDPDVKKMSEAAMIDATRNGTGKMQAYKGKLTEQQIKAVVDYFRTFIK
jgi:mono/diheme cytochrome c family protein